MKLADVYQLIDGKPLHEAIHTLERELMAQKANPFQATIGSSFQTDAPRVAQCIVNFFKQQSTQSKIGAIYLELNAFTINADRWYFDVFGYSKFEGDEDWDWLADWQTSDTDPIDLFGMEAVRLIFLNHYANTIQGDGSSAYLAEILVVLRVNELVANAAEIAGNMDHALRHCRIISDAHDYDCIHVT